VTLPRTRQTGCTINRLFCMANSESEFSALAMNTRIETELQFSGS
jgi:hypothetical protein